MKTIQEILEDIETADSAHYLEDILAHGIYNVRNEASDTTEDNYESFDEQCREAAQNRLNHLGPGR